MTMQFDEFAQDLSADGVLTAAEILSLRSEAWRDGRIDPDEAEALFLANAALAEPSAEWTAFFVEALSEYVVNTVEPHGYVDQDMADELVSRTSADGRIGTLAELELLVRVLEKAASVPPSLKDFALAQIETIVLASEGVTRGGEPTAEGINATECALLRRMVFAAGGDRPAAVSKSEAELLFRLKDAALYENNASEWQTLFVQGVANFLLGFGGHEPLPAERASELETFMASEGAGIGGFLGRMLTSKPDLEGAFGSLLGSEPETESIAEAAEEAAELTADEAAWLHDKLDADEELDEFEKALIAFIDAETGEQFVPRGL